jgi:hypothetical protein
MSARKIDFGSDVWAAHRQGHWLEWAGSTEFPDHLRVAFVAFGRHRANGHARLEREELRYYLVRRDGTLPDRRSVYRSVRRAADLGLIVDSSTALCLVVSSHDVQGGQGDADAPCRRDHTKRPRRMTAADVVTLARTTTSGVVTPHRTTTADVVASRSGLLSSITPRDDEREQAS